MLDFIANLSSDYQFKLLASIAIGLLYLTILRMTRPRIEEGVDNSGLKNASTLKAQRIVKVIIGAAAVAVLIMFWGVDISGLLIFSTTIITLTGVALFANWSILSNVTAFFVLLGHRSFRRGNYVRIIDADNYIEAYIADINLFNTNLITENREMIVYPNNLLLARPTLINPRQHLGSMGKLCAPEAVPAATDTDRIHTAGRTSGR